MTLPTSSPEAMLAWLGESKDADEVADKLRELGVVGRQEGACTCPVALALGLAGARDVSVGPVTRERVCWTARWERRTARWMLVDLPAVVAAFAVAFDCAEYPDLILEQAS